MGQLALPFIALALGVFDLLIYDRLAIELLRARRILGGLTSMKSSRVLDPPLLSCLALLLKVFFMWTPLSPPSFVPYSMWTSSMTPPSRGPFVTSSVSDPSAIIAQPTSQRFAPSYFEWPCASTFSRPKANNDIKCDKSHQITGLGQRRALGLVKFVPAFAYHFCLPHSRNLGPIF